MQYLALLRGINVGGKNKVSMAELRRCFESLGLSEVTTYINSGNVIFKSDQPAEKITEEIEKSLPKKFKLDSNLIKAFVLSPAQLKEIVGKTPKNFGKEPDKYYYDFVFLRDVPSEDAAKEFSPNPEVDSLWTGPNVVYHRRLAAKRVKSRMSKIASKPIYKNMTIRSWNSTDKLLEIMNNQA
jgi:uncharacterized protein (DUF1697 family)